MIEEDMVRLKKLVKEFLDILDTTEESDSGTVFHPVYISSCRVMKTKMVGEILNELKELTREGV